MSPMPIQFTPAFMKHQLELAKRAIPDESESWVVVRKPNTFAVETWNEEHIAGYFKERTIPDYIMCAANNYPAALTEIERLQQENNELRAACKDSLVLIDATLEQMGFSIENTSPSQPQTAE
jgi:hypothetical protein